MLEHRADRLAVADDDSVHAAHLAGLRRDPEAAGGAHERHGRLVAGARDLESRGAARVGERACREERAAPDGSELFAATGREAVREPANRPAAGIQQSGLAGERLAAIEHADEVVARAATPGAATTEMSARTP